MSHKTGEMDAIKVRDGRTRITNLDCAIDQLGCHVIVFWLTQS